MARNPAIESEHLITWNGLEGEDFELGFERYGAERLRHGCGW